MTQTLHLAVVMWSSVTIPSKSAARESFPILNKVLHLTVAIMVPWSLLLKIVEVYISDIEEIPDPTMSKSPLKKRKTASVSRGRSTRSHQTQAVETDCKKRKSLDKGKGAYLIYYRVAWLFVSNSGFFTGREAAPSCSLGSPFSWKIGGMIALGLKT